MMMMQSHPLFVFSIKNRYTLILCLSIKILVGYDMDE